MRKAVLFDLDNTLLGNSMDVFLPAYFQALTAHVAHLVPSDELIAELLRSTGMMDANDGTGETNREAFSRAFFPALDYDQAMLEQVFLEFYAQEFPKLGRLTRRRPEARALVDWAFQQGLQVVIATNPVFPRTAIEQRLAWAGAPVTEFDYALLTSYENMHATKSHPAYYLEILDLLGRQPAECLMVGDDWERDVLPATSVGIPVYWIIDSRETLPPLARKGVVGQGTLADLCVWLQLGEADASSSPTS